MRFFDEGCGPSDEPWEAATMGKSAEAKRLEEARVRGLPWGPYLSEREWGTVREDYSQEGNAWDYFTSSVRMQACFSHTEKNGSGQTWSQD